VRASHSLKYSLLPTNRRLQKEIYNGIAWDSRIYGISPIKRFTGESCCRIYENARSVVDKFLPRKETKNHYTKSPIARFTSYIIERSKENQGLEENQTTTTHAKNCWNQLTPNISDFSDFWQFSAILAPR
jgi:hypothetical protein